MLKRIKATRLILLVVLAFTSLLTLIPNSVNATTTTCLALVNFHSEERYLTVTLDDSHQFALSFIHSVSLTPVVDYYQVDINNKIVQTAERFEQHGAGLPSSIDEGRDWRKEDDYFWLMMERPIEQLIIRTDKDYKNRLYLGKSEHPLETLKKIDLNQWPNQALLITVTACIAK